MANITNTSAIPEIFQNINTTSTVTTTKEYFYNLPNSVMQGDIASIIIALILFFILIILLNKITSILQAVLKRTIVFIIVILVLLDFVPKYILLLQTEGATLGSLLVGVGALLFSGMGLFIAGRSLFRSTREHLLAFRQIRKMSHKVDSQSVDEYRVRNPEQEGHTESVKQMFTKNALNSDKSLITVLIYLIVAEFGVFSSPTLAAPNIKVGFTLFMIFFVGIILFINKAYQDKKVGFLYLGATFVAGVVFAMVLGVVWGNIPLSELISLNFFKSDSLIALISGMSVSLFAGSKG